MLVNLRLHLIAISADVQKVFLESFHKDENGVALRYLWLSNTPKLKQKMPGIQELCITRAPFGTIPSPFPLTAMLLSPLQQINDRYPVTTKRLVTCPYVDDLVLGTDAVADADRFFVGHLI